MNLFKDFESRYLKTKEIISKELHRLKSQAYNPITIKIFPTETCGTKISGNTPFIVAISYAEKRLFGAQSLNTFAIYLIKLKIKANEYKCDTNFYYDRIKVS